MSILRSAPRKIWSFLNIINSIIPKNPKKIFIYSNLGFRDNVRAVYDYLIKNGYNERYRIICSLNDYKTQAAQKNVRFIGNIRGLFSFFTCKYAFYCFGKYPVKPRNGQRVFNLWHGMPLKCIGNMISGCENTDYNYFTHILCTSEYFRDIIKKSFKCTDSQIVICGQPRTDEMLEAAEGVKDSRLLLWLPTFRSNSDMDNELDILSAEQLAELDRLCSEYDWNVIVKLHPLSCVSPDSFSRYDRLRIITQQQAENEGLSFYTMLAQSGCLITDYSSVFFDYLLLDRPMGFAVKDMEKYDTKRGFTVKNPSEIMPGEIFSDGGGMLRFVKKVFSGQDDYKEKRKVYNDMFNRFQDNNNCRRAVETVIKENQYLKLKDIKK